MTKNWIFALLLTIPFAMNAQRYTEVGVLVGMSNYMGDLSPSNAFTSMGDTHFAAGIFATYNISNHVGFRASFNYGKISAEDADGKGGDFRQQRNLSFRSNIFELGVRGEVNILGYQPYNLERVFSPYIFLGISAFKFKPQAYYEGEWVNLQPLGTEGQGMADRPDPYKQLGVAVPLGLGVKYAINDKWNLGAEVGFRKTFTDYLDDVSTTWMDLSELASGNGELAAELSWRGDELDSDRTPPVPGTGRGNEDKLDWFVISGIYVSYNFTDNGLVGSRGRNRRKNGCVTF